MQNCRIEWTLLVFMLILFAGCSKDVAEQTNSLENEKLLKAKNTRIASFINWINGNTLELRDRPEDLDPEEFLNDSRDALNYQYSIPFELYWESERSKDTISVDLSNCLIPYNNASDVYDAIFAKVKCNAKCSNLYDPKLVFVDIKGSIINCNELQVEVLTVIGTTEASGNAGEDEPDPAELPTYKRKFTSALMALWGTCTNFNDPISAQEEMGKKATWNIIGGFDAAHTIVNLQSIVLWPDTWYGNNQIDWWRARCKNDIYEEECPPIFEVQCDVWFNSSGGLTQAGMDKYCTLPNG